MKAYLSLVYNKTNYIAKIIDLDTDINDYAKDLITKLTATHEELNFLLLIQHDSCYYYNMLSGISMPCELNKLENIDVSPNFTHYSRSNTAKSNTWNDFLEIDVLNAHPELYQILPINSEEKIRLFTDFIIKTLNINFHPDDEFSDYLDNDQKITDISGREIIFNYIACDFMNQQIENCLTVGGDYMYEYGTKVLQEFGEPLTFEELVGKHISIIHEGEEPISALINSIEFKDFDDKNGGNYEMNFGDEVSHETIDIDSALLQELIDEKSIIYSDTNIGDVTIQLNDAPWLNDGEEDADEDVDYSFHAMFPETNPLNKKKVETGFDVEVIKYFPNAEEFDKLFADKLPVFKTLNLDVDSHQYDDNYEIVKSVAQEYLTKKFPNVKESKASQYDFITKTEADISRDSEWENLMTACGDLASELVQKYLQYLQQANFTLDPEMIEELSKFEGSWHFLSSFWEKQSNILNTNYPLKQSFDEYTVKIINWVNQITSNYFYEDREDIFEIEPEDKNIPNLLNILKDSMININNLWNQKESSTTTPIADKFNEWMQIQYPFELSFDDLTHDMTKWIDNCLKLISQIKVNSKSVNLLNLDSASKDKSTLIKEIKEFIAVESYFEDDNGDEEDQDEDDELEFSTRENGDVGSEEPGYEDIVESKRLRKELLQHFPNYVTTRTDVVDEWVYVYVKIE